MRIVGVIHEGVSIQATDFPTLGPSDIDYLHEALDVSIGSPDTNPPQYLIWDGGEWTNDPRRITRDADVNVDPSTATPGSFLAYNSVDQKWEAVVHPVYSPFIQGP